MIVEQFDNKNPVQTRIVGNKTIHNIHILDRSGSMSGAKFRSAVSGILDEIKVLKSIEKTEPVTYTQTVVNSLKPEHLGDSFCRVYKDM